MEDKPQPQSTVESEKEEKISFTIKDNVGIIIPGQQPTISIELDQNALSSAFEMIDSLPNPEERLINQTANPIPVYFGSRPLKEVLSERIDVEDSGEVVTAIQSLLYGTPDSAFIAIKGKEFLYVNTPQILERASGNLKQKIEDSEEVIAEDLAHELTHARQHLSELGSKQVKKDALFSGAFTFYGGLNGLYLTTKLGKQLSQRYGFKPFSNDPMSRRQFLKNAAAIAGASVLISTTMIAHYNVYYSFLSRTEKEARQVQAGSEITDLIRKNFSISVENKKKS